MSDARPEWLTRKEMLEWIVQRPLSKKELNRFYEYERDAEKTKIFKHYLSRRQEDGGIKTRYHQNSRTLWENIVVLDSLIQKPRAVKQILGGFEGLSLKQWQELKRDLEKFALKFQFWFKRVSEIQKNLQSGVDFESFSLLQKVLEDQRRNSSDAESDAFFQSLNFLL